MTGIEMVDLYIGLEKEHFRVHKTALCDKIPYFDKMFRRNFQEATAGVAEFLEDNPEAFDLLLGWDYHERIDLILPDRIDPIIDGDEDPPLNLVFTSLYELHALGQKLCLPHLQDQVVDEIRETQCQFNVVSNTERIKCCYSPASKSSGLRRFFAHNCAFIIVQKGLSKFGSIDDLSDLTAGDSELHQDVLAILRSNEGRVVVPSSEPDYRFHCHGKDEPCYTSRDSPALWVNLYSR
jgi:BTB/POZ domain